MLKEATAINGWIREKSETHSENIKFITRIEIFKKKSQRSKQFIETSSNARRTNKKPSQWDQGPESTENIDKPKNKIRQDSILKIQEIEDKINISHKEIKCKKRQINKEISIIK